LEEFQTAILDDDALKGISTINIKLIYDDQIERLKEKEQKDSKKRQRLGENFSDLLYSITVLQLTISMLHYLLTCKLSALIYSVW